MNFIGRPSPVNITETPRTSNRQNESQTKKYAQIVYCIQNKVTKMCTYTFIKFYILSETNVFVLP